MRPQRARRFARAAFFAGAVALVAALYVTISATGPGAAPAARPVLPPVAVVAAVKAKGYETQRRYVGRIEALAAADLSFEVGGRLVEVAVAEGSPAEEGAVLARLDTGRLANRRNALKAELEEARARAQLAEDRRARLERLTAIGAASTQSLESAVADADATAARIDSIEGALASAERDLTDAVLTAPFEGVVAARYVDPGTVLSQGQPVLRLVGTGRHEALIGVPPDKAAGLARGDEIPFAVGDRAGSGQLIAIGDEVDPKTGTVTLRLALPEGFPVSAGELGSAQLGQLQAAEGFWLPATALTGSYRGLWTVYVVEPGEEPGTGTARRETVSVLHAEAERVYVAGTIAEGALIVAEAPFKLVPEQPVSFGLRGAPSLTEAWVSAP